MSISSTIVGTENLHTANVNLNLTEVASDDLLQYTTSNESWLSRKSLHQANIRYMKLDDSLEFHIDQ
jgi:hypothetical protein